ncbi:MAG TPA: WYL domain-containing protein [Anaeromyxobacter sp.]|nr:WYL domain-containing protein [Anaeromyxobacter sp.]
MATSRTAQKPHEARLLQLAAWILGQSEPVTRAQIFAAFPDDYRGKPDAAERKFTRDKDALKRLGFNLETEELGSREEQIGYAIDARTSMLPPIELGPDEAAAVWTAAVAALRLSLHPMREELESALRKLVVGAKGLPPRAAATEELAPEPDVEAEKLLPKLVQAWERRKRLRVSYWRVSEGKVVDRAVDVYGWARRRGEWIFVGHDHLRGATRIFYLSRVRALKPVALTKDETDARARRGKQGDYDIPATFDVRRWSRQQIWDYEVHAPVAATVRFRGSLAGIAKALLPGAQVTTDESGARVARLEVRNLRGLVRQALAWGPEAEVVEPEDGRAAAREILASIARTDGGTP